MASMELMVAIFIGISWIWIQVSSEVYMFDRNVTLTWNESHQYCANKGKVLFDLKTNSYDAILTDILNDTDQAWAANTVELSDFVGMPVCKGTTGVQSNLKISFETDIISNCLTFCKDYRYIGLQKKDCFCIMDNTSLTRSKVCDFTCNIYPTPLCGGNESLSLYQKVDTNITRKIAPGFKECVYAQKNGSATELFTSSCVVGRADGAMCNSESISECRRHHWTIVGSDLCRMDLDSSYSWMQVRQLCAYIGGQLGSSTELSFNLEYNRTYWLGIHRVAKIHEAKEEAFIKNNKYCAVARKEGDLLLIEADDCQAKHAILCQDKDILESTSSLNTKPNERTSQSNITDSDQTDNKINYVAIAVSVVMLIALLFVVPIIVIRKRRQVKHTEIQATGRTLQQHTFMQIRAFTLTNNPFGPVNNETEPGLTPYENIVLTQNEQTLTVSQPLESTSAQADYEQLHTHGEHNTDTYLQIYDQLIKE